MKKFVLPLLAVCLLTLAVTSVIYGQADQCRSTINTNSSLTGQWPTGECQSETRIAHALYYTFSLYQESDTTIRLESTEADTYLYLRQGNATSGDHLYENDDHDDSLDVSLIQETLAAGDYTIEATTYGADETGEFTLALSAEPIGVEPTPPTITYNPVVGPLAGHFHHDIENNRIDVIPTGAPFLSDIHISVQFANPYATEDGQTSYGLILRANAESRLDFYISTGGYWILFKRTRDGTRTELARGNAYDLFKHRDYDWNTIEANLIGYDALLYVNGEALIGPDGTDHIYLGPDDPAPGLTYIVHAPFRDTEKDGAITKYHRMTVYEVLIDGIPTSAEIRASIADHVQEQTADPNIKMHIHD